MVCNHKVTYNEILPTIQTVHLLILIVTYNPFPIPFPYGFHLSSSHLPLPPKETPHIFFFAASSSNLLSS